MKRVCVYCGSNFGKEPVYTEIAKELGGLLAADGLELVYGGGNVGLMGTVADAVIEAGGAVHGVIPQALEEKELAHRGVTELTVVVSMHTRKQRMAELSDGFITLPGGIGTLEELAEIFTWLQLQFHNKPVGILNTNGYYDHLFAFLRHMRDEQFLKSRQLDALLVSNRPSELLQQMREFTPCSDGKWFDNARP
ncbi:MAG: TIGR00730 family Rossman fold protein [Verrucomicrobiales bacterium]|nr:TIGR00730 family Rossman fold protein [Verrucomicrobiales bacterium]|tara:strand:- start:1904 stop:2485 length:582 start_codon:yes stop_codon:yes gene_type:complete